jgi:hypothetical protein
VLCEVVDAVTAETYRIPTPAPESDGPLQSDSTSMVVTTVTAGGVTRIGYSYAPAASACVVRDTLAGVVIGTLPVANVATHTAPRVSALQPVEGRLRPDRDRPGLGIEFKSADAKEFRR